jgi:molybdopterin-dependent oxidoreductase alpha subunit
VAVSKSHDQDAALVPKKDAAGGIPAIRATLDKARKETGLVRGARLLLRVNQDTGFDCPGCAWPEPKHRSRFEFCENGAKAVLEEGTRHRATPDVFAKHSVQALRQMSEYELGGLGRITQPMMLRPGGEHFQPVSWERAFEVLADALKALPSPHRAVFYTSGRTSNEAAFLWQLFVREFGTNNLPDCSNLCHESSGVGMSEVLGVGKGTVDLDDFDAADLILVIGQNPGTNHPRMLSTLRDAARRGAKIVSVNPLEEVGLKRFSHPQKPLDWLSGGVELASFHVPVKIGGDIALLKGVMKEILAAEAERPGTVLAHDFLNTHTEGFAPFKTALDAVSWERIEGDSGIPRDQIRRLASLYMGAERVITCWAMGLTQHKHAVGNVQEIVNLMLLRGQVGKKGAGLCPVRGHSNVQGDRTMGITAHPKAAFLDKLASETGIRAPRDPGFDTVATI